MGGVGSAIIILGPDKALHPLLEWIVDDTASVEYSVSVELKKIYSFNGKGEMSPPPANGLIRPAVV